jgi:ParB family transcriptional regulator, chromosome partitioning protein
MARLENKLAQNALFLQKPTTDTQEKQGTPSPAHSMGTERTILTEIPLEQIQPDPNQPRRDLGDLTELGASIRENGLIQPIVVCVTGYQAYMVLAGERRFTASQQIGLKTIPAIVRTVEEHQKLELQLVENLHRKDLTPLEEAESYQRLIREFSLTQETLAKRMGKSQESINETLRLMGLSAKIREAYLGLGQEAYRTSDKAHKLDKINKSILLEIAKRPEKEQDVLWQQAIGEGLTVRELREAKKPTAKKPEPKKAKGYKYPILLSGVTVTLVFDKDKPSSKDIVAALEEALATEKARLE